jgi:hypothetical protein
MAELPEWWLERELMAVGSTWHTDKRLAVRLALDKLVPSEERGQQRDAFLAGMLDTAEPVEFKYPDGGFVVDGYDQQPACVSHPHKRLVQRRYVDLVNTLFAGCQWLAAVTTEPLTGEDWEERPDLGPLIAIVDDEPVAMLAPCDPIKILRLVVEEYCDEQT